MIKAAFSAWDNRIAPVFDVARQIHIVEVESGKVIAEAEEFLPSDLPVQTALRLAELGIGILICGAISRTLHEMIAANGIGVIPFVTGDVREVIRGWLAGELGRGAFAMPGCCGRFRRMEGFRRQERFNDGKTGMERGDYFDRDSYVGRSGRMRSRLGKGPVGSCVCPKCGQREPHERGVSCVERKCPSCGAPMIRE
jgi:predicted Fe-Mo cluster-binding NifX family protein